MINTIISSSILILIIITIRFVFRGKINPMVQYGLWSLVVLRLVALSWLNPVESALSVMNVVSNATKTIRGASAVEQVISGNAEAGLIENTVLIMDNVKTGVMVSGKGISAAAAIDWQLVIMIVWAMGTIALGLWLIFINHKFGKEIFEKRMFLMSVRVDEGKTLNDRDVTFENIKYLPVYVVDGLDSPCLMRYRGEDAIYVTSEVAIENEKLRYAVAHELCHYKHHDLIWSIVRGGLLALYWFNPLVWVAAIMSKRDCELACDYEVIKKIDKEDRLAYGKTLVDLISQREQKSNVLRMATTMYGSANGIKERVTMIVKNKKMKSSTLVALLLIVSLSVGCTFTVADNNINAKDLSNEKEKTDICAFATKWADAFSQRDAKTIYALCENEELYLTIGGVAENGEYWMGVSSPWPWNKDYFIDIVDSSTIDIYYYFRTSSPTVYTAKETITIKKIEGEYKTSGDSWKHFDKIESKADFDEAYKFGFPDLTEFAAAYQFQADDNANYNQGRKEILENPATAAIDQLNLVGAKGTGIYEDPYVKKAVIKFVWNDGEVTVNLIQPILTDESGIKRQATIWIVVNESELSTSIFSKENVLNIMKDQNNGIQSDSNMALINTYLKSIQDASDDFYDEYFTISPRIDYYNVSVKEISLDNPTNPTSLITFISEPFVGPHDTVGTDEISFLVDYLGNIKLKEFKHIKSYSLPDNLKSLIKKPIPGDYDM